MPWWWKVVGKVLGPQMCICDLQWNNQQEAKFWIYHASINRKKLVENEVIWRGRCGLPYALLLTLCERMLLNFVPLFSAWCFGIKSNKVCLEIDWETRELKLDVTCPDWNWHNFSVNFLVDLVSFGLKFGVSLLSSKHSPPEWFKVTNSWASGVISRSQNPLEEHPPFPNGTGDPSRSLWVDALGGRRWIRITSKEDWAEGYGGRWEDSVKGVDIIGDVCSVFGTKQRLLDFLDVCRVHKNDIPFSICLKSCLYR